MKPVCVPCKRFFRIKKSGYIFIESMPIGRDAKPGVEEPHNWKPYKLWCGDLWECQGCGTQTIAGVAHVPFAEHFQPDFEEKMERMSPLLRINDC